MADTIKTLEAQIVKLEKSKTEKENKLMKLIPVYSEKSELLREATQFVTKEFMGDAGEIAKKCKKFFGKDMTLVDARKALSKMGADFKKLSEERDTLVSESGGLNVQLEALQKKLDTYRKSKEALKQELDSGKIDKKEYEHRKQLIKTSLADATKLAEGKIKDIEKKLGEKKKSLEKLIPVLEKKTEKYTDANEFVTKEFKGDAGVIAKKCKLHFGKDMTLVDARKALEKLKQDMEKTKKEHQMLSAEAASLSTQVTEFKKRWALYEKDMERTNKSLEGGSIDVAEWKRQSENFKKSLAIT